MVLNTVLFSESCFVALFGYPVTYKSFSICCALACANRPRIAGKDLLKMELYFSHRLLLPDEKLDMHFVPWSSIRTQSYLILVVQLKLWNCINSAPSLCLSPTENLMYSSASWFVLPLFPTILSEAEPWRPWPRTPPQNFRKTLVHFENSIHFYVWQPKLFLQPLRILKSTHFFFQSCLWLFLGFVIP